MTSNTAPLYERPDFKVILTNLSSNIQNVMVSWHNVQTVSFRISSQPMLLRNSLAPLRKHLQAHWEDIRSYLQKCHDFSEEAITWHNSFEQADPDCLSLLEELLLASLELCHESEVLIQQSASGMEFLSSVTPQLSGLLHGSSAAVTSSNPAENVTPETNAFLGVSLPPDGFTALTSTTTALAEVRNNLCSLNQFWTSASETCRTLMKSSASITPEHAYHLGKTWTEWQEEIMCANVSIAKSLDAVAVEPVLPPSSPAPTPQISPPAPLVFRRQRRRRGSSKSDASLPSSPISPPRKMSSLDDDGVPKACWRFGGFSFGDRKKK
ncbi:hypothetical protein B0H11DRAFT_1958622 [Mycena galericulata]|nr:hypothetical protein B0H11DRAFT_1958622 [Mycena galericulata]